MKDGRWQSEFSGAASANENRKMAIVPEPEAPLCPVHKTAMVFRHGRYGANVLTSGSCPRRLAAGSWCDRTIEMNGR